MLTWISLMQKLWSGLFDKFDGSNGVSLLDLFTAIVVNLFNAVTK